MTIALPTDVREAFAESNYERDYSFTGKNEMESESRSTFEVAGDEYLDYLCDIFGVN